MLKFFTVTFTLLSFFFLGCGSKLLDPPEFREIQEVNTDEEEELDLLYVKKIEEEERKQEEKAAEFLAQETALNDTVAESAAETAAQVKILAQTEASESNYGSTKKIPFQTLDITDELTQETPIAIKQEIKPDSSTDDYQNDVQQESMEATSLDLELLLETSTSNPQETTKATIPKSSVDDFQDNRVGKPGTIITSSEQNDTRGMFMPTSRLAIVSALKLVSCKNIPEKMEDIYQRLLNTKDINIANRNLRDVNNDRLMPVIHFDFDQITIKPEYQKLLQQQSSCVMNALKSRDDMIVQIEGHADERGSDEYNLALGHRRANAIANSILVYLPNSKLSRILSFGEEFPLNGNSGKSEWGKNRRVEFTLLLKP